MLQTHVLLENLWLLDPFLGTLEISNMGQMSLI